MNKEDDFFDAREKELDVDEIYRMMEFSMNKGHIPKCPSGNPANITNIKMYPHDGGVKIKGKSKKQWVYVQGCTSLVCGCNYQFSLSWFDFFGYSDLIINGKKSSTNEE